MIGFKKIKGLKELVEKVYAQMFVKHMLAEKEFLRAVRAHILVHSALMADVLQIVKDKKGNNFFFAAYSRQRSHN